MMDLLQASVLDGDQIQAVLAALARSVAQQARLARQHDTAD